MNDGEQWVVWCGLNAEQSAMEKALGSECVSIWGSDSIEEKMRKEELWRTGGVRVLITKTSVMGFGMNWQHCSNMLFVGIGDSYETYFQAIRRCWRYGQTRPVKALVVLSSAEQVVYENVLRKEAQAALLTAELIRHVAEFERQEISQATGGEAYRPAQRMRLPLWLECVSGRAG